jgi:hypothetical protein
MSEPADTLVIACGALAREITALKRANGWGSLAVTCLPAELHNRPERIPERVRATIRENRARYRKIFVAYADCGTGGRIDDVLAAEGVERLPGAHCYEFFATSATFTALAETEPGTFYLTDFLLRHFERLVTQSLGLDRHPELAQEYFRHYKKLTYLAQTRNEAALANARAIAVRMNLEFEYRFTGYGELAVRLGRLVQGEALHAWPA